MYFVNAAAPSGGNGLSWATAFNSIEVAGNTAAPGGDSAPVSTEIWVAEGTYKPQLILQGDPRNRSFFLYNKVAYLGGFAGDETNASQRDPSAHPTILSGDINVVGDSTDNSYSVVRSLSFNNATAILDGFTITGGNANGASLRGGGIRSDGSATFANLRLEGNKASQSGGGVNSQGPATFSNCVFIGNTAYPSGAGGYDGAGHLIGCTFENNEGGTGGALHATFITDCVFVGNIGGGAGAVGGTVYSIRGCRFESNQSIWNEGAVKLNSSNPITVADCVFIDNSGGGNKGGGLSISSSPNVKIANCAFLGNHSVTMGGGAWISSFVGVVSVTGCLFSGNSAPQGAGLAVEGNSGRTISNCTFASNTGTSPGAGLWVDGAAIRNCVLWDNLIGVTNNQATQFFSTTPSTLTSCCVKGWTGTLGGSGNDGQAPNFVNVLGADLIAGTEDDDPRLSPGSSCIDSGNNALVPADALDLDGDLDVAEPWPLDLDGNARFFDDPKTPDAGGPRAPTVDRGAFEYQGPPTSSEPGLFIGPPGGSWFVASNWAGGLVPQSRTAVIITGSVVVDGPGAMAASVEIKSGGVLTIAAGTLVSNSLLIRGGGQLQLDDADTHLTATTIVSERGALVNWNAGALSIVSGSWTSQAPIEFGCVGTASLALQGAQIVAPRVNICTLGRLEGAGSVTGELHNDGVLSPGAPIGTLTVFGAFEQGPTGHLAIDATGYEPGTTLDHLVIAGNAAFDGSLLLTAEALVPHLGGVHRFVDAASAIGSLAQKSRGFPAGFAPIFALDSTGAQAVTTLVASGPRLHVRASASPGGDGQSWETAVPTLDGALTVAASLPGAVAEVWVAEGSYLPMLRSDPTHAQSASFRIPSGTAVFGGFAGGETSIEQRDPTAHPTVLTGDELENDVYTASMLDLTFDDNRWHVVTIEGGDSSTVLDGFMITGGNARGAGINAQGGGALVLGGNPTLASLRFEGNRALLTGGAIHLENSAATILNSFFMKNAAINTQAPEFAYGGAICASGGTPTIEACTFQGVKNADHGFGFAIHLLDTIATVTECEFTNYKGGSAIDSRNSEGAITACVFSSNISGFFNSAGIFALGGGLLIDGCDFTENIGHWNLAYGGAVALAGGAHTLLDCTFSGNTGRYGGALRLTPGVRGGVMQVIGCHFNGNSATLDGGAVQIAGMVVVHMRECIFEDNDAGARGGAIHVENFSIVDLDACDMTGNGATKGGGLFMYQGAKATITDSTITANTATEGRGIYNQISTVAGNFTLGGGDDFVNASSLRPSGSSGQGLIGAVVIDGDYRHEQLFGPGAATPTLVMDIAGRTPGTAFDQIQASGDLVIEGGTLIVNFVSGFEPRVGESFDLMTGARVIGAFDVVAVAGAQGLLSVEVTTEDGVVRVTVSKSRPPVFNDPLDTDLSGLPSDAVAVDIELDDDLDLAMAVAGVAGSPGTVQVLRNAGLDPLGAWIGFEDSPIVTVIPDVPDSIAAGDLNSDGFPEIVTGNQSSATASVVLNFGGGFFFLDQTLSAGNSATSIGICNALGDGAPDIVTTDESGGFLRAFENFGDAAFVFPAAITAGAAPTLLRVADLDLDGHDDVIVANTSDTSANPAPRVSIHRGSAGELQPATFHSIGRRTTALEVANFDSDNLPDIVTANWLDQSLTLIRSSSQSPGDFFAPASLPLPSQPLAMTSLDLDGDGDRDLALLLKAPNEAPELRALVNETRVGGPLTFVLGDTIATQDIPSLVFHADVNGDGADDLLLVAYLTGNQDSPAAAARLSVLLSDPAPSLPGDLNHDGVVDGVDLALVLGQWGPCSGCVADMNGDGNVDGFEIAIVLGNWS